MEALFVKALSLSAQAGTMTLAVALVRALTARTRFPKAALVLMWGLVGLRLMLPFSVVSPLSLMPSRGIWEAAEGAGPAVNAGFSPAEGAAGAAIAPGAGKTALYWASRMWPVGVGCMVLYFLVSSLRLRRLVSGAEETERGVWESRQIPAPFAFGFFRPKIYLPRGLAQEHRGYILAHERAHIRRGDHLVKPLAFLLLAVYWFNPLLWLAYAMLSRDMELACDELVLRKMGPQAKRPYAQALLAAVTFHRAAGACPVAFGKGRLRGRVGNVLRWRRPTGRVTALAVLLCLVLGACLLTDPAGAAPAGLAGEYKFAGEIPEEYGPNVFGITLFEDGHFSYFETYFSSNVGMGDWICDDGGVVTLTERRSHFVGGQVVESGPGMMMLQGGELEEYEAVLRFRVTPEGLVYLAEGSDNFSYIHLQGGELFRRE